VALDGLIAAAGAAVHETGARLVKPGDVWPMIVVAIEDGGPQSTLTERELSPQGMHRLASRLKTAMRRPAAVALVQPIEYTYGLPRRQRLEWLMVSASNGKEDATFLATVHRSVDRPPALCEFRAFPLADDRADPMPEEVIGAMAREAVRRLNRWLR
jgi:hypothetical protein